MGAGPISLMCGSIGSQVKSRQHEGAIRIAPVVGSGRMAIDYDAPSSLLVIALLTDPRTRRVLIRLAYWSTRSIQDAEDLVSDAAVRIPAATSTTGAAGRWRAAGLARRATCAAHTSA